MLAKHIYEGSHQWIVLGRDPDKPEKIIDTNQYLVIAGGEALLLDPGGIELFPAMFASTLRYVGVEQIRALFASHQDPDIISSLGLWDQVLPKAKLYGSWMWEGFIRHFGMNRIDYAALPDEGASIALGGLTLEVIPAHYLHSSGNFHLYDRKAKILFSGDVGAALEPLEAGQLPLFVDDFEAHTQYMRYFHQRWMPSNRAKLDWIKRVRALEIDMMVPQHGRLFRGEQVSQFLDWFELLEVGVGIASE